MQQLPVMVLVPGLLLSVSRLMLLFPTTMVWVLSLIHICLPCGLSVYQYVDGVISPVFHNHVFYEIMGYSDEDILLVEQKTDFLGVHPEDAAQLKRKIGRAIRNNGVVDHDYRVWNSKKQKYGCIHLQGAVKPQEDGTKLLYGVYSDVSEQRRLESALKEARLELDHLINSIPGGIAS